MQRVLTTATGPHAAYLRHRLDAAWGWVGLRPAPEWPQDGRAPRLGRTGLGTLGPRSATPITPFRVRVCPSLHWTLTLSVPPVA